MDVGGPGVAVLSGRFSLSGLRETLGFAGSRVNLLVVEEPWVQRRVSPECREALSTFYRSVRTATALPRRARELAAACRVGRGRPVWGHGADDFRGAVAEIVRTERLALRGVVAASFGSVRWEHLATAEVARGVAWTVLIRPFPVGAAGHDIVSARADAAERLAGPRVIALPAAHRISSRSWPVTRFDQLSAQLALAYDDDPAARRAVATGHDLNRVGHLSDTLWMRYGTDQISAGYLAYLDEVCAAGAHWPPAESVRSVRGVLVASHLPCPRTHQGTTPPAPPRQPTCVVTSRADAVTPRHLIQRSYGKLPHVQFVTVAGAVHGSLDGLNSCLETLGIR